MIRTSMEYFRNSLFILCCAWSTRGSKFSQEQLFSWPKTNDKSGFGEKSGCDKLEDAMYLILLNQPVLSILI